MNTAEAVETQHYWPLPTLREFHESDAQIRCIVGPVGSGKTSAASLEVGYYLPWHIWNEYGLKHTRWVVVRNTYPELRDTTQRTFLEWFPDADHKKQANTVHLRYDNGITVEVLFRSCDNPKDVKKFKSLEITGYWIDESIEVADDIKKMLKNRIGRFPKRSPVRYGIETTNPPDVEHTTYSEFAWQTSPPGPIPEGVPKPNHVGFWQPPRENEANLRANYYDDLLNDYSDSPDWAEMYVEGKPGIIVKGKLVYNNFRRDLHVARNELVWAKGPLFRGWDNSGNIPACVVAQIPTATRIQILKEFHSDRMNIVDFARYVVSQCSLLYPEAEFTDWGDPAGWNEFSTKDGGFTSNAKMMKDACGVNPIASENNLTARIGAVEDALSRIDGLLIDPSCVRLINGFIGGYCYPQIAAHAATETIYGDKPLKNRFSHIHDALQYVIVKIARSTSRSTRPYIPPRKQRIKTRW